MNAAEMAGGAAVVTAAGFLGYASRAPSCTWLAPSVYRGDPARRAIALTFDDGPSESTPELLRILKQYHVPATFFQCGRSVRRLPEIARQVLAEGHLIGNHTDSHAFLWLRSPSCIYRQMATAQDAIEEAIGERPRWFRPPFGARWFGLAAAQQSLGLNSVLWSTIGKDWKWPADRIVARLMRGADNGAIFCLHDGRLLRVRPDISATLEAVRRIMPALLEKGFRFETVSDILCPTTT